MPPGSRFFSFFFGRRWRGSRPSRVSLSLSGGEALLHFPPKGNVNGSLGLGGQNAYRVGAVVPSCQRTDLAGQGTAVEFEPSAGFPIISLWFITCLVGAMK